MLQLFSAVHIKWDFIDAALLSLMPIHLTKSSTDSKFPFSFLILIAFFAKMIPIPGTSDNSCSSQKLISTGCSDIFPIETGFISFSLLSSVFTRLTSFLSFSISFFWFSAFAFSASALILSASAIALSASAFDFSAYAFNFSVSAFLASAAALAASAL